MTLYSILNTGLLMVWRCQYLNGDGSMVRQEDNGKVSDWGHCAVTSLIMSARSSFSQVHSLTNYPRHDSTPRSCLSLFCVFFTLLTPRPHCHQQCQCCQCSQLTLDSLHTCFSLNTFQWDCILREILNPVWNSLDSEYEINITSPHCTAVSF